MSTVVLAVALAQECRAVAATLASYWWSPVGGSSLNVATPEAFVTTEVRRVTESPARRCRATVTPCGLSPSG